MLSMHTLLLFIATSLMINLMPGPDMLFIISRAISGDKRGGVWSVVGISVGLCVHTLVVASGLAVLIIHSPTVFQIIKWAGAAYLVYLGFKTLFSQPQDLELTANKGLSASHYKIFRQALLTNLLNPKIIVFFLSFLPQFINPMQPPIFLQFILLGCTFIVTGTTVNFLVVLVANRIKYHMSETHRFQKFQQKVAGLILVGLGILSACQA